MIKLLLIFMMGLLTACDSSVKQQMDLTNSGEQSFYIWQRAWTGSVKAAVRNEKGLLYPLTSEFDKTGSVTVKCDWNSFSSLSLVTPVIRVHINWLDRSDLIDLIVSEFKKYPTEIKSLQLDLDCPQRRLGDYAILLKQLKNKLPDYIKLSITVLPCHLNSRSFMELLPHISYYVLQLHGIEVPKRIDLPVELINFSVVERALERAIDIGSPFKIALPTYAYRLFFDKDSGKFIRLSSENNPKLSSNMIEEIISADLGKLFKFICKIRSLSINYQGIIWFRLPTSQDALTISRQLINQLAIGDTLDLKPKVFLELSNSRYDLFIENPASFSLKNIKIVLEYDGVEGDWDLAEGFTANSNNLSIQLPQTITGKLPPPGRRTFVGWFRPIQNKKIRVSIQCLEE